MSAYRIPAHEAEIHALRKQRDELLARQSERWSGRLGDVVMYVLAGIAIGSVVGFSLAVGQIKPRLDAALLGKCPPVQARKFGACD